MDIFATPQSIAPLVQAQFPEFYSEEGEGFIAFLKAYYEWLETKYPRNVLALRDIDHTTDDFIIHFKETYLKNIQFDVATNKRLLVKNSLDLYRAKGTERAVDLFMKLVYGRPAKVYYPGDDIFRLSDADYAQPKYIEVSASSRNVNLVGKQITGTSSKATAFVERYIKRKTNIDYIHILYVSNPQGTFVPGELLSSGTLYDDSPVIIGSVVDGSIVTGGGGFAVGDIISFTSDRGREGLARITEIGSISGIVKFTLIYGGFGFSTSAQTIVSDTVLTINGLTTSNTSYFPLFSDVNQPIVQISYSNANGTIAVGGSVNLKSNNTTVVANGTIVRSDLDTNATGIVYVYSTANSIQIPTITQIANSFTANTGGADGTVVDLKATATTMAYSNTFLLTISNTANIVTAGTRFYQYYPNTALRGTGVVSKVYTSSAADVVVDSGFIVSNSTVVTTANSAASVFAFVNNIQGKVGVYQSNNSFYPLGSVFVASSTTTGIISAMSHGSGAGFTIGTLSNQENVFINSDYLRANTAARLDANNNAMAIQTMMSVPLNAYAYGFAKNPQANLSSTMYSSLNYSSLTIGTIATLSSINPGQGYDDTPMVLVYEPAIGGALRYDFIISVANATGNFFPGENIHQTNSPGTVWTVTVADGNIFTAGQVVYQDVSANTIGIAASKNGNTLTVNKASGSGFVNGAQLYSNSTSNSTITTATIQTGVITAFGNIRSIDANNDLHVARLSFDDDFVPGVYVVGESSGVSANTVKVVLDTANPPAGYNAIIAANTVTSNNIASHLQIVDSGIGYTKNENVVFTKVDDPLISGTFRVTHSGVGTGQGYFRSTKGFLSSNKYLFDGEYYQEYSYEVLSSIPFDKYKDVLDKVLHVAGTRAYGSVLLESKQQQVPTPKEYVIELV